MKITYADGSKTEFAYDGLSRRNRITERNAANTITSDKRYVWSGGNQPAEERDVTTNAVTKRFFAQGEQRIGGSDAGLYYYAKDHLGSIREITNSSGTLAARYDYDLWGKRTKLTGSLDTEVGFTGHHHHTKSGLVLTWYRAYDAETGKWLSPDPLGESGGINLYGYVAGNPISYTDPLGLLTMGDFTEYLTALPALSNREAWGTWTGDELGESLGLGAMATADGFIPFSDPFQLAGGYTGCEDGVGVSSAAGMVARDAAMIAGGLPLAGSKTFVAVNTSKGTNAAGQVFRRMGLGKIRLPFRIHLPTGGWGTGTPLRWPGTRKLATALGRSWPWVSYGTSAVDLISEFGQDTTGCK